MSSDGPVRACPAAPPQGAASRDGTGSQGPGEGGSREEDGRFRPESIGLRPDFDLTSFAKVRRARAAGSRGTQPSLTAAAQLKG